jgi:hypothetical protein
MLQEDELQSLNLQYWDSYDPNNPMPALNNYIKKLLPEELQYMQSKGRVPAIKCDLLVLLVGHSLEPLLQTICHYNPQTILLIANKQYASKLSGDDQAARVRKLVSKLRDANLLDHEVNFLPDKVIQASTVCVFQALQKRLHNLKNVVVDITGAKKNMSAGAFLYAAYANIPITYVDTNDTAYDETRHQPYGYDSTIRILETPYQTFGLRDWEKVQNHYEQYNFRFARLLLSGDLTFKESGIIDVMRNYLPDAVNPTILLLKILECYEQWDSGNYYQSKKTADVIMDTLNAFHPPDAIVKLGDTWPQGSDTPELKLQHPDYFYNPDSQLFQVYVFDELARIKRQIVYYQDYRSSFLSAGSLNEIIMLARVVRLFDRNDHRSTLLSYLKKGKSPRASSINKPFVTKQGQEVKLTEFGFPGNTLLDEIAMINLKIPFMSWQERLFSSKQPDWGEENTAICDAFLHIRNKLAHQFYAPPRIWAEEALAFVTANVNDLWPGAAPVFTDKLPWREICKLTGLDQYLALSLID